MSRRRLGGNTQRLILLCFAASLCKTNKKQALWEDITRLFSVEWLSAKA
jgi:hypothetical protein